VKKKKKQQQQLKELKKLKWVVVGYSQLCLLLGGGGIRTNRERHRKTQRERMLNFEFAFDNPVFSDRILNLEVIPSAQAPPSASSTSSSSSSSSSQVPIPLIFYSSVFFFFFFFWSLEVLESSVME
jgi:hypothetical protein